MTSSQNRPARIAVLGANGQVGGELCLLMGLRSALHPIAVARSEHSLALLRKLGIECRSLKADSTYKELLQDCDAVVDLVHPWQTNTSAMRRDIKDRCRLLHYSSPARAPIIYASTMSVYRLDRNKPFYTIYRSTKLLAERDHISLGKAGGRRVYVLRLGQVHGALQGCSLELMQQLRTNRRVIVPQIKSFSVFVSTISEAVEQIVDGRVPPGIYTLISDPAWSYEELARFWAAEAGVAIEVRSTPIHRQSMITRVLDSVRAFGTDLVHRNREQISDWMWHISPDWISRERFKHHHKLAVSQITAHERAQFIMPFLQELDVPGARIATLSDSRSSMPPLHAQVKSTLAKLTS